MSVSHENLFDGLGRLYTTRTADDMHAPLSPEVADFIEFAKRWAERNPLRGFDASADGNTLLLTTGVRLAWGPSVPDTPAVQNLPAMQLMGGTPLNSGVTPSYSIDLFGRPPQ